MTKERQEFFLYFFPAPFDTLAKASTQGACKKYNSGNHLRQASVVNLGCFGFSAELSSHNYVFSMSDCFTSKRDELRLGQDLTEGNERKATMKKPKDH